MASNPPPSRTQSVLGLPPLLDLARERGLDSGRLLRRARIAPALLDDPMARIPFERECALVRELLERTGDRALGLEAGRRYHLVAFGLLGSAVRAVPTVREAIRLFLEHLHLTYTPFAVSFLERGHEGRLVFVDDIDLGSLRRFYLERDLSFVLETAATLWPERYRDIAIGVELDYPEPPEVGRYAERAPCPVRFGCELAAVVVDLSADRPRPGSSPLALRLLEDHLRAFGTGGADADLVARVRRESAIAVAVRRELPDARRVAAALGMSDRALRRRLSSEGHSFRAIADDVLSRQAERHLRGGLSVDAVAERLGYAEAASFVRAFRRWTGQTPERYRASRR